MYKYLFASLFLFVIFSCKKDEMSQQTKEDSILIKVTTLEQLNAIRYDLNGDGKANQATNAAAYSEAFGELDCTGNCKGYELMSNLDFAGTRWENPTRGSYAGTHEKGGWLPIGDDSIDSDSECFNGTFNGNNYTISNLYIDRFINYIGLFGCVSSGKILNVNVEIDSIVGNNSTGIAVGGLVGSNDAKIEDCSATGGTISSNTSGDSGFYFSAAGGLVGYSNGSISNSYATVAVSSSTSGSETDSRAGGLVGYNGEPIIGCYATGTAEATGGHARAGGLVGENTSAIIFCYATGATNSSTSGNDSRAGGLVGFSDGSRIQACYATGAVSSNNSSGGLVGYNKQCRIVTSYATGNVVATGSRSRAGGLLGENFVGTINACYARGTVTSDNYAGGLVGKDEKGSTMNSYATGTVNSSNARGLVGDSTEGGFLNSYFDYETSEREASENYAKSTSELQTPTAYISGSNIYADWNRDVDHSFNIGVDDATMKGDTKADDPWDFGTDMQYPALKVDFDASGDATVDEFGDQIRSTSP